MSPANDVNSDGPKLDNATIRDFLAACSRGEQPSIDEFVMKAPLELRDATLQELTRLEAETRCGVARTTKTQAGVTPEDHESLHSSAHQVTVDLPARIDIETINDQVGSASVCPQKLRQQSETKLNPNCTKELPLNVPENVVQVGDRLGKYEIRSVLGVGGMGVVYAAYDTVIERDVAIKLLNTKHTTSDSAKRRLLQEAKSAGSLQHSNIVGIYDVLIERDLFYVVMECVRGKDLSEVLQQSPKHGLDWRVATRIIAECCDALSSAHQSGMFHRDIKPQNIMLTTDDHAKLLDFGLAKSERTCDTGLTQQGTILGTPDFMSPEQCNAGDVTCLTDIYSLGATYFTLLTGTPPFASEGNIVKVMYAHCHKPVPDVEPRGEEIPAGCNAVIRKSMAKNPVDRFQSAAEMKTSLAQLLAGEEPASDQKAFEAEREDSSDDATGAPPTHLAHIPTKSSRRSLLLGLLAATPLVPIAWMLVRRTVTDVRTIGSGEPAQANDNALLPPFRGILANSIHLGTTSIMNGPSEELGRSMVIGMRTCFAHINDNGGVNERKIELTVLDDGYDPERALANMKELLGERQVFATIGNVGTPTATLTSRYASDHHELFFAPLTGASFLREVPPDRYVFNYRASYQQETAALVDYFVNILDIAPERIAVFAQDDSYGDDGYNGVVKALRPRGVKPEIIIRTGYERNQPDIDHAIETVLAQQNRIDAIVMVPTYKVAARFVQRIREVRPRMRFGMVSYVDSQALADEFLEI